MFFPGLEGKVDIINSTLGKALGGAAGGYTTAKKQIVNLLRSCQWIIDSALEVKDYMT